MKEKEKEQYYGNQAFETIYEKAKKDYAPQLVEYTPLDEKTLTERISAVLRPVYEKAIAAIFRNNKQADAELDADAISRGMGSSTFVTDVKRRQDTLAAEDAQELESEYGAKLADQLSKAMEGERDRMLDVEKFNAQQRNAAAEQAFTAAQFLYAAYLEAKTKSSGGGGGSAKKEEEKAQPSKAETKKSLAKAVASARGKQEANPNGAAFYATGDTQIVDRVTNSDLPKYVKLRGEMNGTYTANQLKLFRKAQTK